MYASLEPVAGEANQISAKNNSLDLERTQVITAQSKAVNEINIKRIEKDSYIVESYKIMQDWLKQ